MGVNVTKGKTLGYDQETALGTSGGSYGEIRWEADSLGWPTNSRIGVNQMNVGHAHSANRSDKPIWHEIVREAAGPLPLKIRRSASANTAPPIAEFFESMGCVTTTTTSTTVATYVSTTNFTLTDTDGSSGVDANIIMPLLDDGTSKLDNWYYPTLIAVETSGAITPAMALPAATDVAEPVEVMTTIMPRTRAVPVTKTLAFKYNTRGDLTDDGSNDLSYLYTGCAGASVDEMTWEPGKPLEIKFNFHLGDVDQVAEEIAAETMVDGEKFCMINEMCRVEFADWTAAGAMGRADGILRSAKFTPGIKVTPRKGFGSGTLNDISGYDAEIDTAKLVVTVALAEEGVINGKSFFTELEGSNVSKYIAIVQPTNSLATPAAALFCPNCHLDGENPPVIVEDSGVYEVTATFLLSTAGIATATNNGLDNDIGYSPWFFGISGAGS